MEEYDLNYVETLEIENQKLKERILILEESVASSERLLADYERDLANARWQIESERTSFGVWNF